MDLYVEDLWHSLQYSSNNFALEASRKRLLRYMHLGSRLLRADNDESHLCLRASVPGRSSENCWPAYFWYYVKFKVFYNIIFNKVLPGVYRYWRYFLPYVEQFINNKLKSPWKKDKWSKLRCNLIACLTDLCFGCRRMNGFCFSSR